MTINDRLEALLKLPSHERLIELRQLSEEERKEFAYHWRLWARDEQLPPAPDWQVWLILAGRGFGKTRAGAEWIREVVAREPCARIALVAATLGEARAVMVEGESGVIAIHPTGYGPTFEPSLRRLTWANGAQAVLYSALEPESLRGPQHSHAPGPGAKGGFRQRSPRAVRCPAASRHRGRGGDTAGDTGRWRELARRFLADGCLGGARRQAGLPPGGELAFRDAAGRSACSRSVDGPGASFFWNLENC